MYLVVLHLALCCVTVLLQMTRRSPKGKNIVTSDQSTPAVKRTRLLSQSFKDSNLRGLELLLTHTSTQASLTWHLL